jgi:hypothetical protein
MDFFLRPCSGQAPHSFSKVRRLNICIIGSGMRDATKIKCVWVYSAPLGSFWRFFFSPGLHCTYPALLLFKPVGRVKVCRPFRPLSGGLLIVQCRRWHIEPENSGPGVFILSGCRITTRAGIFPGRPVLRRNALQSGCPPGPESRSRFRFRERPIAGRGRPGFQHCLP